MPVEFVGILALQACVDIFVALIGVFITYYIVKAYNGFVKASKGRDKAFA